MNESESQVPRPAAATPEEWEPFLRASRSTDDNPIIFTERQLSRIQWITAASLDRTSPDHELALDQLRDVNAILRATITEAAHGSGVAPSSTELWVALDAKPYYLCPTSHAQRLEHLRSLGLDPYGNPLDGNPDQQP